MHVQVNLFCVVKTNISSLVSASLWFFWASFLVLKMTNVFVVTLWFYKLLLKKQNCILQVSHSTLHKQNLRFSEPWHSPLKEATFRVVNPCECQYKVWPKHTQPPPELLARDVNLWYNRRANNPVIVAIIKFT